MANFFKKKDKKSTDPLKDVHMALMSLPTISIIFGTTAMVGDPLISSLGSVASAILALSGVIVGSRGVNGLVERSGGTYPVSENVGEKSDEVNAATGWSKLKKVGDINNYQGFPFSGEASKSMSGDNNAKHLNREQQRMRQEEKDLAEAKKILEDSKEQRDNDFSSLFSNTVTTDDYSQEDFEDSVMDEKLDLREQSTEK